MPRFIIERTMPPGPRPSREAALEKHQKSLEIAASMPGVAWIRSYVSEDQGKVFCEYEAPTIEDVYEHSRRAGIPVDRVSLITVEMNRDMFL
jgi:hypothetical protein